MLCRGPTPSNYQMVTGGPQMAKLSLPCQTLSTEVPHTSLEGVVSKDSASLPPTTFLDQVGSAQPHTRFIVPGASTERPPCLDLIEALPIRL